MAETSLERAYRLEALTKQFPLSDEVNQSLTDEERKYCVAREKEWNTITEVPVLKHEVMQAVYLKERECPLCKGRKGLGIKQKGALTGLTRVISIRCQCEVEEYIQHVVDQMVPRRYRDTDLWTLQPSTKSQLLIEIQSEEIDFMRQHAGESFLFAGPAGCSKTTYAVALLRESLRQHVEHLFSNAFQFVPEKQRANFVWRVNGEELFTQNQLYKTTMTNENPAPPPEVTPERLKRASERYGCTPLLIIEEMDKSKFTESRMNFLFSLFDALDGVNGKHIITTNRTLDRFVAMFTESESEAVRVSAEPLLRRMMSGANVRDYFKK
jgi:DNA replication protein DnaC